MNVQLPSRDELWKQYEIQVDLYKHYLKLTLELNALYYAITGAILSYFFAHKAEHVVRFSLALPIVMSVTFGFFFFYGAKLNKISKGEMARIRDALTLQVIPDFDVLTWFLRIAAILMFVIALVLLGLLSGCLNVG